MPKIVEKKEIITVPEGICKRLKTKILEDGKSIEITMLCEVKTEQELRAEVEAKARKEAEEKARKEAEARARKEAEEKARKEAEAKARKEAEEKARKEAEAKAKKEAEEKVEKEIEKPEKGTPTLEEYMKALQRQMVALNELQNEERKFAERMNRDAIPPEDLPSYWAKYSEACSEVYKLSEEVTYSGKKAKLWAQWGFKNVCKTWKLKEYWFSGISEKVLLSRTITWKGTLEDYCQSYELFLSMSMYTSNLRSFAGMSLNPPEGVHQWADLQVDILD